MNEFEKNQDKTQTGEQGGKPAFDQFDKQQAEQGQQGLNQEDETIDSQEEFSQKGEPIDQGQQEQGQTKQDELAGTGKQDDQQR